jgi:hypothetical protein
LGKILLMQNYLLKNSVMKKYLFIGWLLSCVFSFMTCSEEGVDNNLDEKESSISERFSIFKEIATYHSEGLGFAYEKIKNLPQKDFLALKPRFRTATKDPKIDFITTLVTDYMFQEGVIANISLFETELKMEQVGNKGDLRSSNAQNDFSKIFSFFDKVTDKVTGITTVQESIEAVIKSEEFTSLSEEEQNVLLFMFAIYEDSSNYWDENLVNWQDFLSEESDNGGLKAAAIDGAEDIDLVSERSIWKVDAVGAVVGAVGGAAAGAVSGAIAGSAVGGVGAAPGAAAGAVSGAISGGISTAIVASLTAWLLPLEVETETPTKVPTSEEFYVYLTEEIK